MKLLAGVACEDIPAGTFIEVHPDDDGVMIPRVRPVKNQPLKKEFVTYWTRDTDGREHLIPCSIKFMDLIAFVGHKTKVTIEIIE